MAGRTPSGWDELLTWTFEGPRFEDHGVDLRDLADLVALRELLIETTEELWRRKNPERERLLKNFQDRIQLKIFGIDKGSAKATVYARVDELAPQTGLADIGDALEIRPKLLDAARLVVHTFAAGVRDEAIPHEIPPRLLPKLGRLTASMGQDEAVSLCAGEETVRVAREVSAKLLESVQRLYEDTVDLLGEVTMASLKGRATIEVEGRPVEIRFTPEQEKMVTLALHEHDRVRLAVKGRGTFELPSGRLKRVTEVTALERIEGTERPYDPTARPIWEVIAEIGASVPDEEWEKVPRDLAENHDHYLYGAPKPSRRDG